MLVEVGQCWVVRSVPDLYRVTRGDRHGPGDGLSWLGARLAPFRLSEGLEHRRAKVRTVTLRELGKCSRARLVRF